MVGYVGAEHGLLPALSRPLVDREGREVRKAGLQQPGPVVQTRLGFPRVTCCGAIAIKGLALFQQGLQRYAGAGGQQTSQILALQASGHRRVHPGEQQRVKDIDRDQRGAMQTQRQLHLLNVHARKRTRRRGPLHAYRNSHAAATSGIHSSQTGTVPRPVTSRHSRW